MRRPTSFRGRRGTVPEERRQHRASQAPHRADGGMDGGLRERQEIVASEPIDLVENISLLRRSHEFILVLRPVGLVFVVVVVMPRR